MTTEVEIKNLLLRLLHGIRRGEVDTYRELVSEELTCFEPETKGHGVEGLPFHFFFIEHSDASQPYNLELVNPIIRVYGDTAYTAYTMLIQKKLDEGFSIDKVNETRIFHRENGNWKMVHFHRS